MAFEHILFDLDGTLTDSYEGIAKCVQYALHYYGIEENNLGELADLIISAAHLEAAGHLQVLGLEVELAVLRELGGFDEVCFACYILEDKGGVVDLIQCQHIGFPILSLFIHPGTRGIFHR